MLRLLASGLLIFIVWTVLDVLMHRFLLRQIYEDNQQSVANV